MCRHGGLQGQLEGRRKGWLAGWKAGREDGGREGEGRVGAGGRWGREGRRGREGFQGSSGTERAGARCCAVHGTAAGQQPKGGGGGPRVPGRYMLRSSGTAPAPCLMAAVGAARGLHVLIFLPLLLLLLLFHFIREQLMANKWQRDGQGMGRGWGRSGRGGVSRQLAGARGPGCSNFLHCN